MTGMAVADDTPPSTSPETGTVPMESAYIVDVPACATGRTQADCQHCKLNPADTAMGS